MKRAFFLLLAVPAALTVHGKVLLPSVFGDNMVLQQQQKVRVWGDSDQKEVTLSASWRDTPVRTEVIEGRWTAEIETPAGSYVPQTLTVRDADSELTLGNVLIGEVWICSGQSNMYMPLRGYTGQPVEGAMRTALESPLYGNRIRMITLPKKEAETPQRDFEGHWEIPSPATSLRMSAAAYYFAQTLTRTLGVPVGIISASWGGSKIEAWMNPASLRGMGYDVDKINADPDIQQRAKCGLLYNGLIAPVAGYTARGFAWYQGESNRRESGRYARLMQEMVGFWRARWGDTKAAMPFLYVQIAPYDYKDADATDGVLVMEAQSDALKLIPNAAMIATTDLGEKTCIHPRKKREVGERLAAEALIRAYGMRLECWSGVRFRHAEFSDGKAVVTFDNARYGLTPQGEDIPGFELAGADGIFHPAVGRIVPSKPIVEVTSEAVAVPTAVRYAFRNYTPTNLRNTLGLPAFPFRTDRP
ncbi:sialate O-acetylesterase [Gallalistipes aquisgranensis]|uniref:sialate O-acetylesterase n=1 Tax=Gallalistipes aquisgranensis TaxID=2779358 RepID=UPI001CF8CE6B|nr:sialate O-acetylesterase [Gallalistipes aquisgranensis]MBE5032578.1 sialate O-acetylesterase [Gallalistipes aquisgranensis]